MPNPRTNGRPSKNLVVLDAWTTASFGPCWMNYNISNTAQSTDTETRWFPYITSKQTTKRPIRSANSILILSNQYINIKTSFKHPNMKMHLEHVHFSKDKLLICCCLLWVTWRPQQVKNTMKTLWQVWQVSIAIRQGLYKLEWSHIKTFIHEKCVVCGFEFREVSCDSLPYQTTCKSKCVFAKQALPNLMEIFPRLILPLFGSSTQFLFIGWF